MYDDSNFLLIGRFEIFKTQLLQIKKNTIVINLKNYVGLFYY